MTLRKQLTDSIRLVLVLSGIFGPFALYRLQKIIPQSIVSLLHAYAINPKGWSRLRFYVRDSGDIYPTRGQGVFILLTVVLNAVFSALFLYTEDNPSPGQSPPYTLKAGLANRLGALAVANMPLIFVFSTRNNVLLRLTGK